MFNLFFFHVFVAEIIFLKCDKISLKGPELKQITSRDDIITLQCSAYNYNAKHKVHFKCAIQGQKTSNERCYEDCIPIWDEKVMLNCTKEIFADKVVFNYLFNKAAMPSGSYHCSYRNMVSHKIKHVAELKRNISTTVEPEMQHDQKMKFEFVLLILSILIFSIILNVVFLLRCFLTNSTPAAKRSCISCLCIEASESALVNNRKTPDDIYDNIHDMPHGSVISRSNTSSGHEINSLLLSSTQGQFTRSATFPVQQAIFVHSPSDQMIKTLSSRSKQPYMVSYVSEGDGECIMAPSSMRHFASAGSLNNRPKRLISSHTKASPLPEENRTESVLFTNNHHNQTDEGVGSTANDVSSTYDINSSQGTNLSGKESDSFKDPIRSAKLEMSREMMVKADTLLREAHHLLKQS